VYKSFANFRNVGLSTSSLHIFVTFLKYVNEPFSCLQTHVFSMKDDIRDLAANLYAIIVSRHPDENQTVEALESMLNAMNNKV